MAQTSQKNRDELAPLIDVAATAILKRAWGRGGNQWTEDGRTPLTLYGKPMVAERAHAEKTARVALEAVAEAELVEYEPLLDRLTEVAKEAVLAGEPNGRPDLTVDEAESFDRRTRTAVLAILNHVVFTVPRREETEEGAALPPRTTQCKNCDHTSAEHEVSGDRRCSHVGRFSRRRCACWAFEAVE